MPRPEEIHALLHHIWKVMVVDPKVGMTIDDFYFIREIMEKDNSNEHEVKMEFAKLDTDGSWTVSKKELMAIAER